MHGTRHSITALAVLATVVATHRGLAEISRNSADDAKVGTPNVATQSLEELCKMRGTLKELETTVNASRQVLLAQKEETATRFGENESALKSCLAAPSCPANERDRLSARAEILFEQRYALDGLVLTLDVRVKQQGDALKRLDELIQGKCP